MTVIARRQANCANARLNTDEQHTGLDELIRKLVSHVAGARDSVIPANPEFSREEIVVDTSVDGVRYLMVRMPSCNSALISLSPREQQISRMVARGYHNKTIAGVLNISAWTVCTHIRRIFAKLGVASRAAMVARILQESGTWEQRPEMKSTAPPNLRSAATPMRSAAATAAGKNAPERNLAWRNNR
jgi:DNA-binding CsgD family transcriptional regulator